MVSIMLPDFQKYLDKHTSKSVLLKCFCAFILKDFTTIGSTEINFINEQKRDYKSIAALGYLLQHNLIYADTFTKGLAWLSGRKIDKTDTILTDNAALLGIALGLHSLPTQQSNYWGWYLQILNTKQELDEQDNIYSNAFKTVIGKRAEVNLSESDLGRELNIFSTILLSNQATSNSEMANYFVTLRNSSFPYYQDDFFRTMIGVYNSNFILYRYILNQEQFLDKIKEAVLAERQKQKELRSQILEGFKHKLHIQARRFSKWVFAVYIITLSNIFFTIGKYVWFGDWNWLEPKTFVLLGIPLLPYILTCILFLIMGKGFSLNPESIIGWITDIRTQRLYKKFEIDKWDEIQE